MICIPQSGQQSSAEPGDAAHIVTLSPLEIIIRPGLVCGVNTPLPPFLIIWNVECKPEFKIVKVTLCVMDLRGRGVTSLPRLSPGFIKCRKAETCRIFPFSWKNVFFSLHCHSTDVLETWVMILASCQTLPVFYILPHSYLVWLISFLSFHTNDMNENHFTFRFF